MRWGRELDELEERVDPFLDEWGSEEQTRRRRRGRLVGSADLPSP
jgi:hypothetical protein